MKKAFRYEISGLVQGVGFRPFVYNLALKLELKGEIYNDDEGIKLALFGESKNLAKFEKELLANPPELARIDKFIKFELKFSQKNAPNFSALDLDKFNDLKIIPSKSATKTAPILPDFALCADCEREFYDPKNRRYHYAFINCTNCGPRFSIIKSLPYDRLNTTMSSFKMCADCEREYKDPLNRRYHAQPISCPNCGPRLSLKDMDEKILASDESAVKMAAKLIKKGKILAIKGLGGFHLVCDASDKGAIKLLRERKNRPQKPFAIMCKDLKSARELAEISQSEAKILTSNLKPIVILRSKKSLPDLVAPNLDKIGIFLPNAPIQMLLFKYLNAPIIATSANISGEPIISSGNELSKKLKKVIDFYLDHDREIYSPSDDSIAFVARKEPIFIRTSRGLNPKFIHTNFKKNKVALALGAELKNQFAIFKDNQIIISPYIGDLKNVATYERFCALIELFERTYDLKFDLFIADLHPHFLNLKFAQEYAQKNGAKIVKIQHHFAHLLSVIFENNLKNDAHYLGFCFDGTGYGADGKIWGGEVLRLNTSEFKRLAHFDEFALIGAQMSIKNIYQIAYSIILKYDLLSEASAFLAKFDEKKLLNLKHLYEKNINSPLTSSLGRVFDAFGCVILGLNCVTYEGEVGMRLEALYDENLDIFYKFELKNGVINFKNAFISALKDEPKIAATAFINGLAKLITDISKEQNLPVLLSGGVFQNRALLKKTIELLEKLEIKFYINRQFCANDANICVGQMCYFLYEI